MNQQTLEIKLLVSNLAKLEISHIINFLVRPIGYVQSIDREFLQNPKIDEVEDLEQENITFILDRQMLSMGRSL
jgi:hypothetical protein